MLYADSLRTRISARTATVGIIGLGYVGLPLALAFAERGWKTIGFELSPDKLEHLNTGRSYIASIADERIAGARAEGRLRATADFSRLVECDAVLICVPTPLTEVREPDLSHVISATREIAKRLRAGQLVVLESTTYPGTTDRVVKPLLAASGLVAGEEFFLAFSPEREDPGNLNFNTTTIPKLVGGCDPLSAELAHMLYAQAISQVVLVSNAATAEAAKITENVFRAVNIALVNELKVVYERMGINVWEVLDAAATKPFGFMRFNPGPGWGGHCIPLDPFYLSWRARECGVDTKFIELAGEVNRAMPTYVVERLQQALNERCKPIKGSAVLLLGVAYKKDIADSRESPAYPIAQRLLTLGARLSYHDPYIEQLTDTHSLPGNPQLKSVPLTAETLSHTDAVLVVTDHTNVDYELVKKHAHLIVDTRGVYREPHERVVRA
jgi:UDP-N-acetyl-D-glucosamine dehydrogenase